MVLDILSDLRNEDAKRHLTAAIEAIAETALEEAKRSYDRRVIRAFDEIEGKIGEANAALKAHERAGNAIGVLEQRAQIRGFERARETMSSSFDFTPAGGLGDN